MKHTGTKEELIADLRTCGFDVTAEKPLKPSGLQLVLAAKNNQAGAILNWYPSPTGTLVFQGNPRGRQRLERAYRALVSQRDPFEMAS